jgi:hypothetical protein
MTNRQGHRIFCWTEGATLFAEPSDYVSSPRSTSAIEISLPEGRLLDFTLEDLRDGSLFMQHPQVMVLGRRMLISSCGIDEGLRIPSDQTLRVVIAVPAQYDGEKLYPAMLVYVEFRPFQEEETVEEVDPVGQALDRLTTKVQELVTAVEALKRTRGAR